MPGDYEDYTHESTSMQEGLTGINTLFSDNKEYITRLIAWIITITLK